MTDAYQFDKCGEIFGSGHYDEAVEHDESPCYISSET